MKRGLVGLALAVLLVLVAVPAVAHHGTEPGIDAGTVSVRCEEFHTNNDDPIAFPGQPGKAHQHQYTGAADADASSTYASMRAGGTRCPYVHDTTGYWWPALKNAQGVSKFPWFAFFYYRQWGGDTGVDQAFPAGLKMLAGPRTSTTINTLIGWNCTNSQPYYPRIINCANAPGSRLTANIAFPSCWDGVHLDSANHKSHMRFPTGGVVKTCPTSHPVRLPRLIYHIHWQVYDGQTGGWRISSDTGIAPNTRGYSLHADFWNTWDQPELERLVQTCLIDHDDVSESALDPGCRNMGGP